jgi:hypothetical protein
LMAHATLIGNSLLAASVDSNALAAPLRLQLLQRR